MLAPDRKTLKRRRELRECNDEVGALKAKLKDLQCKQRQIKNEVESTTKHSRWHAERLSYQDRECGYSGDDAEARYYVRAQPAETYFVLIKPFIIDKTQTTLLEAEVAAVRENHAEWTKLGKQLLFERARVAYEAEYEGFVSWQHANPDKTSWRIKAATKNQWMLIQRTADWLGRDDIPERVNRGEAHDWLERNGANVRLRSGQYTERVAEPHAQDFEHGGDE